VRKPIPVKLQGVAITASTMKENKFVQKEALKNIPPKLLAGRDPSDKIPAVPREIAKFYNERDNSLYGSGQVRMSMNDFYLVSSEKTHPKIYVKNNEGEYVNLRYLKANDDDYYRSVIRKSPTYSILEKSQFEQVRRVLVEGEIITLGGYLHYNYKEDEFQISHLISVAAGYADKMFKNGLKLYNGRKKEILKYIGIFAGISILFFYFGYQRSQYTLITAQRCQEELAENGPIEDGGCTNCMYYRATVIFLPCYHIKVCEM